MDHQEDTEQAKKNEAKHAKFVGPDLVPSGELRVVDTTVEYRENMQMHVVKTTVEDELGFRFSVTGFAGGYMGSAWEAEGEPPEGVLVTYVYELRKGQDRDDECWDRMITVCTTSKAEAQALLEAKTPRFFQRYTLTKLAPPTKQGEVKAHW